MTNLLDEIRSTGLPVTWPVIRAGWEGTGLGGRQLDLADVTGFACDQLAGSGAGDQADDIADLCIAADSEDAGRALSALAPDIPASAVRTWRAVLLGRLLTALPASAVAGLTELTSFWGSLGFPADMPHVVQGRGNDISPADYYTVANYQRLLRRHRDWLSSEIASLTGHAGNEAGSG
jgi:Uncharacterized protein conserved in bacteria (DUF2247)